MDRREKFPDFSLLGGPLHRLGCRVGLVPGGTNSIALGLALGAFLWIVLVALAFIEGISQKLFSLSVIGGHVRLLVAIPLFFMCETWIDLRFTAFVREIVRIARWNDSWLPEALCLLAAALLSLIGPHMDLPGATAAYDPGRPVGEMALTGLWYWFVCMTLFRFLMLRWLWRLALWCHFLWRVSRLDLRLVPTHPDGVAGLGYLEVVHVHFNPLIVAVSAIQAASFAEEIHAGTMTFATVYPALAAVLVVEGVLFLGPMLILCLCSGRAG